MNVGWRYDSTRHALAARGVRTGSFYSLRLKLLQKKGPVTLYHGTAAKNVPGIMEKGLVSGKSKFGFQDPNIYLTPSVRTASGYAHLHGDDEEVFGQGAVLKVKIPVETIVEDEGGFKQFVDGYPVDAKDLHALVTRVPVQASDVVVLPRAERLFRDAKESEQSASGFDDRELKALNDARKKNVEVFMNKYFARKSNDWESGPKNETPGQYIKRNMESTQKGDGLEKFEHSVKRLFSHPIKDLDGEWTEYTRIADNDAYGPAGRAEPLSKDLMGRTIQRGAALFGRVATQANVEPLIDKEKGRGFREAIMDIEFGRRLD